LLATGGGIADAFPEIDDVRVPVVTEMTGGLVGTGVFVGTDVCVCVGVEVVVCVGVEVVVCVGVKVVVCVGVKVVVCVGVKVVVCVGVEVVVCVGDGLPQTLDGVPLGATQLDP
jgi:hypothetical protein